MRGCRCLRLIRWSRLRDGVPLVTPCGSPARRDAVQNLALQRSAGNRAVSSLVTVQRCGPIPAAECPCNDGAESDGPEQSTASAGSLAADQSGSGGCTVAGARSLIRGATRCSATPDGEHRVRPYVWREPVTVSPILGRTHVSGPQAVLLSSMLGLQRSVGNAAVAEMMATLRDSGTERTDPAPTHPLRRWATKKPFGSSKPCSAAPNRADPHRDLLDHPHAQVGRQPPVSLGREVRSSPAVSSSCLFLQPARGRVDACGGRADSPGDGAAARSTRDGAAARRAGDGIVMSRHATRSRPQSGGAALRRGVLDERSEARMRARRRGRRARSGSASGSSAASARRVVDAAASRAVRGGGEQLTTAWSC